MKRGSVLFWEGDLLFNTSIPALR